MWLLSWHRHDMWLLSWHRHDMWHLAEIDMTCDYLADIDMTCDYLAEIDMILILCNNIIMLIFHILRRHYRQGLFLLYKGHRSMVADTVCVTLITMPSNTQDRFCKVIHPWNKLLIGPWIMSSSKCNVKTYDIV